MSKEFKISTDRFSRVYPVIPPDKFKLIPEFKVMLERRILVPIVQGQPDYVRRELYPIDPSLLPPNYLHTWAIDITAAKAENEQSPFPPTTNIIRLVFSAGSLKLDWQNFDRVTILDSSGNLASLLSNGKPAKFSSLQDIENEYICIPRTLFDNEELIRFYIQLETGNSYFERTFKLEGLKLRGELIDNPAAFVIDDEFNYQFSVKCEEFGSQDYPARFLRLPDGTIVDFPWSYEEDSSDDAIKVEDSASTANRLEPIPPAFRSDGWYLIGCNIYEYDRTGYAVLLYYNEQNSKLRVYLYNLFGPQMEVTYYRIRICLLARSNTADGGFIEIKGAFFPLDPSPRNWHQSVNCIPYWPHKTWAFIEIPFLYPMSTRLPQYTSIYDQIKEQDRFWPIYDESCESNMRNFGIRVEVQGITESDLRADIDAQAIGDAVQTAGDSQGLWDHIVKVASTFGTMVQGAFTGVSSQKWGDKKTSPGGKTTNIQELTSAFLPAGVVAAALFELGPAVWGTVGAVAGLFYGIYKAFFSDPEPLKLAIRLGIVGNIIGEIVTKRSPDIIDFYLPGKFSLQEALKPPEHKSPELKKIGAYMPRYDRTIGHLGFYKHPKKLEFPMLRLDDWEHTSKYNGLSQSWSPRSRVEPCGWRSLWIFPSAPNPKFPYCGTFFEHATHTFSGRYVEYIRPDGRSALIKSAQEALILLQSKKTKVGTAAGHNGPFWVQVSARSWSNLFLPPGNFPLPTGMQPFGSNPKEGTLNLFADLGLRIFDAQIDINLGVRNSQMAPVGFVGIIEDAKIDSTNFLVILVRSQNLEAPEYYGGPKWILSNITISPALFNESVSIWPLFNERERSKVCKERLDFSAQDCYWSSGTQANLSDWRRINEMLPIIFNPYAEIIPGAPKVVNKTPKASSAVEAQEWNFVLSPNSEGLQAGGQNIAGFEWEHDISWLSHVKPAQDDSYFSYQTEKGPGPSLYVKVFDSAARHPLRNGGWQTKVFKDETTKDFSWIQSSRYDPDFATPPYAPTIEEGYTLSIVPKDELIPQYAATFLELSGECYTGGIQEYMMADPNYNNSSAPEGMWPYNLPQWFFANPISPIFTKVSESQKSKLFIPQHFRPFNTDEAFPVSDVFYFWNVMYFYYGRSRKFVDEHGSTRYPSRRVFSLMRAPVTMKVTRHIIEGETVRKLISETHNEILIPSCAL